MSELKPCPACGKPVELEGGQSWHDQHCFLIKCYECGCSRVSDTDKDECVRRWNALPRPLRWRHEPPTEPGWYFCQRICPGAPKHYPLRVVHIHYDVVMGKRVLCYGGCAWYGVEDDRQESSPLCDISKRALEEMYWAGPIQEPKEEFAADNIHEEWFTSSFDDIVKSLTEKTIEVCPVLEQLKTVFTESSSAAFLENMKRVTGWNDNKKIVSPNYDDSWIFTKDRLPDKELGQILVDLYPLSGVHSYEVIEYIDGLNAFFSCEGDTKDPVDFSTVLCWKPIYPPAPLKA